jgi:uncharacterized protein (DUF1800 family)
MQDVPLSDGVRLSLESYIAQVRFGMGVTPGMAVGETRGWLGAQLEKTALVADQTLPSTAEALSASLQQRALGKRPEDKSVARRIQQDYRHDMQARLVQAVNSPTPLLERLVWFWSNHFSVSYKGPIRGMIGAYEREAIRPFITGKFIDLLNAVEHHPVMLTYLDNQVSIGPNSAFGKQKKRGLNENLAREILELHTLGVHGGYSQADVTNFAKVITGWSIASEPVTGNGFMFHDKQHEPGAQTVLGVSYAQEGEAQGKAVLQALAKHPATATHIATKLARYFIADSPPPSAVAALAKRFSETGGDLKQVYLALLEQPEAWQVNPPKIRSSSDLMVAALRLTGMTAQTAQDGFKFDNWALQSMRYLGDMPFTAISPAGFGDKVSDIAGPEAMLRRAEWAQNAARVLPVPGDVSATAEAAIGPVMSPTTRSVLQGRENPRMQLALLLASPEFQRR